MLLRLRLWRHCGGCTGCKSRNGLRVKIAVGERGAPFDELPLYDDVESRPDDL